MVWRVGLCQDDRQCAVVFGVIESTSQGEPGTLANTQHALFTFDHRMILADDVVELTAEVLIRGVSLLRHAMRPAIVIEAMAFQLLLMRDIWDDDCQLM